MTTKYDPETIARLIAEARAIIAKLEQGIGVKAVTSNFLPTLRAMADQLEAASLEILALKNANASLIPDAILAATDVECLRVERDGARGQLEWLRSLVLEFLAAEEAWDVARWGDAGDVAKYQASAGRSDAHAALVAYRNTSKVP